MAYITFLGRKKPVGLYQLNGPTTLGRSLDCDVYVPDVFISRSHCRIEQVNGSWRVIDTQSSNGVWCQGRRHRACLLKPGDTIEIGTVAFIFNEGTPDKPSSPVPFGMGMGVTELMDTVCTEGIRPWEYSKRQSSRRSQWLVEANSRIREQYVEIPSREPVHIDPWVREEWAELDVELQIAHEQAAMADWQPPIFNPSPAQRNPTAAATDRPAIRELDSIDEEVQLRSASIAKKPAGAPRRIESFDGVEFIPYTWRDRLRDRLFEWRNVISSHAKLNPQLTVAVVIGIGILVYAAVRFAAIKSGPHYYIPEESKVAQK